MKTYTHFRDSPDSPTRILPEDEFWFGEGKRWLPTSRAGLMGTGGNVYRRPSNVTPEPGVKWMRYSVPADATPVFDPQ